MFDPKEFIRKSTEEIRMSVREEKAIAACSGGVDSVTATFLAHRAVGGSLSAVFIDDGLRREGEPEFVAQLLKRIGVRYMCIDAKDSFFEGLRNKVDAEEKRKAFREIFYRQLGQIVREEGARYLVQGTIAADIDETVGGIKTQHNVLEQIGIDPKEYGFELVEPLRHLYKPEVRAVARELALPEEVSGRMAFPGPGLSVRVLGEVTRQKIEVLRKATKIVEEETKNLRAFQSFAVLLSDKATGIKNGERVYGGIMTIRVVESEDAITASVVEVPYCVLFNISKRITGEIPTIARCLFDITHKPPATIEFE